MQLVDESEQLICSTQRDDVNITPKLGNIPREVAIKNIGMLTFESNSEVDRWLAGKDEMNPNGANAVDIAKLESSRTGILLSILLVPITLWLLFKYAIPYAAIVFADAVPDAAVELASSQTLKTLDYTLLDPSELKPELREDLLAYWQTLIERFEDVDAKQSFNIQFRASEKMGANAFALPDGTIVFTDELVILLQGDKSLLTSVLLHEMGHVYHEHSMRLIAETLVTTVALSYFFGDVSGILEFAGGVTNTVVQNQFTQDLEWEADNFALAHAKKAGISENDFAQALSKLAETIGQENEFVGVLQSHPLMQERIENAINAGKISSDKSAVD